MATTDGIVRNALDDLDARLDHWRQTLVEICRIPSISASGFPPEEVRRGPGHGFVSVFDTQGNFLGRVATGGPSTHRGG
jgi:hypothetical protein